MLDFISNGFLILSATTPTHNQHIIIKKVCELQTSNTKVIKKVPKDNETMKKKKLQVKIE